MDATIYSMKGEKTGTITLPDNIFAVRWNADLVKQVSDSMLTSRRTPVAHTKNRGEVRGGGKKPWQQKGTGRARHGSTRSPIWVGGGVTHGPRNDKNFDRKVSKKMKAKALYTVLSRKLKENEIVFVSDLNLPSIKTKLAKDVMDTLFDKASKKKRNAILISLPNKNKIVDKSFKNFSNVKVAEMRNLNIIDLLTYKYAAIVDPEKSISQISSKLSKK